MPAIRGLISRVMTDDRIQPYPLPSSQCIKKWMVDGVSEDTMALVYQSLRWYVSHQQIKSLQTQAELVALVQCVLRNHDSRDSRIEATSPLNLSGLNLANGHWTDVSFQNVKLSGTSFKGGVFHNVSFRNCEMDRTLFQLSSFCHVRIANTKMDWVNFNFCALQQLEIVNSALQFTKCEGAFWQAKPVHNLSIDVVNTISPLTSFPPTHVFPYHNQLIEFLPHYLTCRDQLINPAVRSYCTTLLENALRQLTAQPEMAVKNSEAVRLLKTMNPILPTASQEAVDACFKPPSTPRLLSALALPHDCWVQEDMDPQA